MGVDLRPNKGNRQLCVADPPDHADEGSSGEDMKLATLPLIYYLEESQAGVSTCNPLHSRRPRFLTYRNVSVVEAILAHDYGHVKCRVPWQGYGPSYAGDRVILFEGQGNYCLRNQAKLEDQLDGLRKHDRYI
jgi:hypothetical protein